MIFSSTGLSANIIIIINYNRVLDKIKNIDCVISRAHCNILLLLNVTGIKDRNASSSCFIHVVIRFDKTKKKNYYTHTDALSENIRPQSQ